MKYVDVKLSYFVANLFRKGTQSFLILNYSTSIPIATASPV
jgi:hypothetical protein